MTKTSSTTDHEALRQQLHRSEGPVLYSDLRAHLTRDAVFVVTPDVSLLDCAVAVATDDVAEVTRLLQGALLRKPTAEERESWSQTPERTWQAVVVQPYVLIQ